MAQSRRKTIQQLGTGLMALPAIMTAPGILSSCGGGSTQGGSAEQSSADTSNASSLFFNISLAQWSLHRAFFGPSRDAGWDAFRQALQNDPDSVLQGTLDPRNFPRIAKNDFGISAVEYVNVFFFAHAENTAYLNALKQQCTDEGVTSQLIMCDGEGDLGDQDEAARIKAVENHYKWVDAASFLGCHSIRVNASGQGSADEVKTAAVDGLGRLSEYGAKNNINIIVENHGGYSSDGSWLADVMRQVNSPNCGTLPDFGNFCIESKDDVCTNEYDRYKGTQELMPYAKGVSAKSHDFDSAGNEVNTDFGKMLQIVKDAGFDGHIGIEYEGDELSEPDGIKATKALLEKVGGQIS